MDLIDSPSDVSTTDDSRTGNVNELAKVEAPQVLKPDYGPAQLGTLVCYVRDMVLLFDLKESDWNNDSLIMVEKWLQETEHPVLFVYFDENNVLTASVSVPLTAFYDATYFIRGPNEIFQVDTFHDTIQYGTVHDDADGDLLHLLDAIYAPHFFEDTASEWSERVKENFLNCLDNFLITVGDLHYKISGLTVLSVPCLPETSTLGAAFECSRFEKLIIHWMGQIRTLLGDSEPMLPYDLLCPSDDYDFWVYRDEVLNGLILQFDQHQIQRVIHVLEAKQSIYVKQFNDLVRECLSEVVRVKDNIKYLSLLVAPCQKIESSTTPAQLPALLPNAIHLILFIQRESEHLSAPSNISRLFRALSNQIIMYCRSNIDMVKILAGFPKQGIQIASMSIDCCIAYREIFAMIMVEDNEEEGVRDLDQKEIFNHVDTFIQRLYDLITICEAMVVFGRYDEEKIIPKPKFANCDFQNVVTELESQFNDSLAVIKTNSNRVLNILDDTWAGVIAVFKQNLKRLDEIFMNLIRNTFKFVRNIDDRIEVLCSLINFSKRSSLAPCFQEHVQNLYDHIIQEMNTVNELILARNTEHRKIVLCEKYSGESFFLQINHKRVVRMRETVAGLTWLDHGNVPNRLIGELLRLEKSLRAAIDDKFEEWKDTIKDNMIVCLQRSLLIRSVSRPGLLESNVDRGMMVLFREATHFRRLGYVVPIQIAQLFQKSVQITQTFENTITLACLYNKIVCLTDKERILFRPMIKSCEVTQGIHKLNWTTTEANDVYIGNCLGAVSRIQDFLTSYKMANKRIVEVSEKICMQVVLHLDTSDIHDLEALSEHLTDFRKRAMQELVTLYREVVEQIVLVHDGFAQHRVGQQNQDEAGEWWEYVKKIDKLLERAFCSTAQLSLRRIYSQIRGPVGSLKANPFIRIQVVLDEKNKVAFRPETEKIATFFANIFPDLLGVFKYFKRLQFHLQMPNSTGNFFGVVKSDEKCQEYHHLILEEIRKVELELANYANNWLAFRSQWTLEKGTFMARFNATEPSPDCFHANISKYTEIANHIAMQESVLSIRFLQLDASNLKDAIIKHIDEWQRLHINLLRERSFAKIDTIYAYIQETAERISQPVTDRQLLNNALALHEDIQNNIPKVEEQFTVIRYHFMIMDMHNVEVPLAYEKLLKNLDGEWEAFLEQLKDNSETLQTTRDQFG